MSETLELPRELHHEKARKARVEFGAGQIEITRSADDGTHVHLEAQHVDEAAHELVQRSTMHVSTDGDIVVDVPHRYYRPTPRLVLRIHTPVPLEYRIKAASADITADIPIGESRIESGSGDLQLTEVSGQLVVNSGSGDVRVRETTGAVRVNTGSGDIQIDSAGALVAASSGSGDVQIGEARGPAKVKVGSGDITIDRLRDHSVATTGSGDIRVEAAHGPSVALESARGDVYVGVPKGIPTYLDLTTVTGDIHCDLEPIPQPDAGTRVLALRARTVSGDITVERV